MRRGFHGIKPEKFGALSACCDGKNYVTFNLLVEGSNPSRPTKQINSLQAISHLAGSGNFTETGLFTIRRCRFRVPRRSPWATPA